MSIFSAIGSLVGGLFGNKSAEKRELQAQRWQENVMKKQIQWKMADAKAAGVHPIAAMGHSMISPSPTMIGRESYSDMGQNVGRALDAVMTTGQKVDDYTRSVQALNIERMNLENDVLRTQLANSAVRTVSQAGNAPPFVGGSVVVPSKKSEGIVLRDGVNVPLPQTATAQDMEDEFGDLVSEPYGVNRYLNTMRKYHNQVVVPQLREEIERTIRNLPKLDISRGGGLIGAAARAYKRYYRGRR